MRLIDADALIEQLISNGCMFTYGESVISAFISRIEAQTTVDIKTEVAKEIFAEIKQGLEELSNTYREKSNYSGVVHTVQARGIVINLENKYIGGVE